MQRGGRACLRAPSRRGATARPATEAGTAKVLSAQRLHGNENASLRLGTPEIVGEEPR